MHQVSTCVEITWSVNNVNMILVGSQMLSESQAKRLVSELIRDFQCAVADPSEHDQLRRSTSQHPLTTISFISS